MNGLFVLFPLLLGQARVPAAPTTASTLLRENVQANDRLRAAGFRTPCVSVMVGKDPTGGNKTRLTSEDIHQHLEVRLRAAGLKPIDWDEPGNACAIPPSTEKAVTPAAFGSVAISAVLFPKDTGEFTLILDVYRFVKWQAFTPTPQDDGVRAGVVSIDERVGPNDRESIHFAFSGEKQAGPTQVLESLDRLLDELLAQYLKANDDR
jgi:hypothetical protein